MNGCVIVDFGMGNLRSIQHKLIAAGVASTVSNQPEEVASAELLILPGVGHFARGMENLSRAGLTPVLHRKVTQEKTPVLGICLGMQLMTDHSEEGDVPGLGWMRAKTRRFDSSSGLKVPHVGWSSLTPKRSSPILEGITADQRFYFTHSYHICCDDPADLLTTTNYGGDFVSIFHRDNILGVQFHPEKSHRRGMMIVTNFIRCARASFPSCS